MKQLYACLFIALIIPVLSYSQRFVYEFQSFEEFVSIDGITFFVAQDAEHGKELWKTDGSEKGTVLVKDIYEGGSSSNPANLFVFKGSVYFSADNGILGSELYKTDGTASGTIMVKNIHEAHRLGSQPGNFTQYNNELYFTATNKYINGSYNLYKTDGTAEGTVLVYELGPYTTASFGNLTVANNKLYFRNSRSSFLYEYDSATNQVTVKEIDEHLSVNYLNSFNNELYFITHTTYNQEIHFYRLPESGTIVRLKDFAQEQYGNIDIKNFIQVGDQVYFSMTIEDGSGNYSNELWKTDGTPENTLVLKSYDWKRHLSGSEISNFTSYKNQLYFNGGESNSYNLMKSDGTAEGTVPVSANRIIPVDVDSRFVEANDLLYFSSGLNIWSSDGTDGNTTKNSILSLTRDTTGEQYFMHSDGEQVYFKVRQQTSTYTHSKLLYSTEGSALLKVEIQGQYVDKGKELYFNAKKDSLILIPLTIHNKGLKPLRFSKIEITGGEFYLNGENLSLNSVQQAYFPQELAPGKKGIFNLSFFPSKSGFQKGLLTLYSNDTQHPKFTINLSSYTTEERASNNEGLASLKKEIQFKPDSIAISNHSFSDQSPLGSVIGFLSVLDNSDDYIYTLISGEGDHDNASFQIENNQLQTNKTDFDATLNNTLSIRIQAKHKDTNDLTTGVLVLNVEAAAPQTIHLESCPLVSQSISYELRDIIYINQTEAVAVGSHGMILKSYDGGLSWSQIKHKAFSRLLKLQFVSDKTGYALGERTLLKTIDKGETWTSLENPSVTYPYGTNMLFINPQTGFIIGNESPVYKTTDGGKNWRVVLNNYNGATAGFFLNDQMGFLCGNAPNTIWKTTDAGESWETVNLNLEESYNRKFVAIHFTTDQKGLLFDNKGNIYTSNDGGSSWTFNNAIESAPTSLYFYSENSGYVAIDGKLYKTEDGGETWSVAYDNYRLTPLAIALSEDQQRMLMVGQSNYYSGNVIAYKETGTDWQITSELFSSDDYPVSDFSEDLGFHASENGIHITQDGGLTWQKTNMPEDYYFSAIKIAGNSVFLQGNENLFKSTDLGETWVVVPTKENTEILHIINDNELIMVGRGEISSIYKSSDGGLSYTEVYPEGFYIRKAHFLDSNHGIILGFNDLLITKDGGNTWTESTITTDSESSFLRSAAMYNTDVAIVGSDRGVIYKTLDGGINWERIPTTIRWSVEFLHAKSELEWYASDGEHLYVSNDGGYSWQDKLLLQEDFHQYQVDNGIFYFTGGDTDLFKAYTSDQPPVAPAYIEGPTLVQVGSTTGYSVIKEENQSYIWEISGGQQLYYQNNTARITWDSPGVYELSITPYTACTIGKKQTYEIKVQEVTGDAPAINGPDEVVEFSPSHTYSITPKPGASYQWLTEGAISIKPAQHTVEIDWGNSGTGIVQVIETDTVTGNRFTNNLEVTITASAPPVIQVFDATCRGKSNGRISVSIDLELEHTIRIQNLNTNALTIEEFNKNVTIENLSPGGYSLCLIRTIDQAESCYWLEVGEPEAFSVKTKVSKQATDQVEIAIQGGTKPYSIFVNGKEVARTLQEVVAVNAKTGDYLEVVSNGSCAVSFEAYIYTDEQALIYPNPTSGPVTLDLVNAMLSNKKQVKLNVYSSAGLLLKSFEQTPINHKLNIDLSDLPDAVYLLKIDGEEQQNFKLIKQ